MKLVFTLIAICLCVGCAPIYKKLQPSAEVIVIDTNKAPIENAQVSLVSNAYPYGIEKSRETKSTNASGIATFESKREWRIESLMLHGSEIYFWNWCVVKEGYESYITSHNDSWNFEDSPTVVLKPGESQKCPEQFR